ncbi:MAG: hypothetical protein QXI89_00390 [Candidatus Anstonellales archaeon]
MFNKNYKNYRGFFLSLAAIIALIIISSLLAIKMAEIEQTRLSYSESIKLESYKAKFLPLNKDALEKLTQDLLYDNLYKLANHTAEHKINPDNENGENTTNVVKALYELMIYGSANSSYFNDSIGLNSTFNLTGLIKDLNDSMKNVGLEIAEFNVSDLNYSISASKQGDAKGKTTILLKNYGTVEINTTYNITIRDKAKQSYLKGSFNIYTNITIDGMPDALVNGILKSNGYNNISRGVVFKDNIETFPSINLIYQKKNIKISKTEIEGIGQSWVYGSLRKEPNYDSLQPIISYGSFNEISNFGTEGFIVNGTGKNITISSNNPRDPCDGKEYEKEMFNAIDFYVSSSRRCEIVLKNKKVDEMFLLLNESLYNEMITNMKDGNYYLILTNVNASDANDDELGNRKYDLKNISVYDIELARDIVINGYYVKWAGQHDLAPPNFFQRMLVNGYEQKDSEKGIFSFIITKEFTKRAGNDLIPISRADYEYNKSFTPNDILVIKGFPGCKTASMCKRSDLSIGRFAISKDLAQTLGLENISCKWEDAKNGC